MPTRNRPRQLENECQAYSVSVPLLLIVSLVALLAHANVARCAESPPTSELLERARNGDTAAQVSLAVRYRDGKGVPKDSAEAMRWGHMAADKGDPAAMDFVGYMYFRGVGVRHNADVAVGYFKAAAGKCAAAAWNLGQCYFAAQGVEPDIPKALETWKIALRWKLITFTPDDAGFDQASAFIRAEIDAGRPLVIDFKYIGPQYPNGEAGHTLVIAGYIADENLYILCNPAISTPGLQLISAADLKHYWRSDHYGELSHNVLSRPAIVADVQRLSKDNP